MVVGLVTLALSRYARVILAWIARPSQRHAATGLVRERRLYGAALSERSLDDPRVWAFEGRARDRDVGKDGAAADAVDRIVRACMRAT